MFRAYTRDMPETERKKAAQSRRVAWRCACFNLRRGAREVTRFYDSVLAPSGLTATRFTLLGAISQQGEISVTALARALGLDRTTLTRNLAHLERDGLVVLRPGIDRRERRVALGADGEAALRSALPLWRAAQDALRAGLGRQRWQRLSDDLGAVAEFVEDRFDDE